MAMQDHELTHDERMLEGLRAIWRETYKTRVAVQSLLVIVVALILFAVLAFLMGVAFSTD